MVDLAILVLQISLVKINFSRDRTTLEIKQNGGNA